MCIYIYIYKYSMYIYTFSLQYIHIYTYECHLVVHNMICLPAIHINTYISI